MLQGLGHKEKIQDKDAKCKGVRWGHSYDDGVQGGTLSQEQGRVHLDQGHQIRV